MILRKILRRMLSMCSLSWYIFLRTTQLCVFLLFCAVVLLIGWQNGQDHSLLLTAISLNEIVQALLLIAVLASALIEDCQDSKS